MVRTLVCVNCQCVRRGPIWAPQSPEEGLGMVCHGYDGMPITKNLFQNITIFFRNGGFEMTKNLMQTMILNIKTTELSQPSAGMGIWCALK